MAHARRAGGVAAVLVYVLACSGCGSKDKPPAYTLSGTIRAAAATDADGDTADATAPQTQNDTPGTAQLLPGAVTVGGWASLATDAEDWYRATLAAGQVVTLHIAEAAAADLDLHLFHVADPITPVASSDGLTSVETVTVPPGGGEFFVLVLAAQGTSSNYVLMVAQAPLAAGATDATRFDAEFVPGEVVVRFKEGILPAGASNTLEARAASVGLLPLAGAPHREMLLGLGAGAARTGAFAALGAAEPRRDLVAEAVDPAGAAKADTIALVKALRRRPDVASADLNWVHHPSLVPDDTSYPLQWHYPLINLPQAWDVSIGSASVIVAVVDTGVFLAHPDLAPKLVPGYDFILDPARARRQRRRSEPGRPGRRRRVREQLLPRHARRGHRRRSVEQRERRRGRLVGREDHAHPRPRR